VSIDATAALLGRVFPSAPRISRPEYLRWLYVDSPFGPVIEANIDDAQGRAAHYALVPVALSADGEPCAGALSLNTAVDERARGAGAFSRLAAEAIEEARGRGVGVVVGVANANSTPGFIKRLSFDLLGPLPATILVPLPGRSQGVRSTWAEQDPLEEGAAGGALESVLAPPQSGLARLWTPETLRWRLRSPGARYALHRSLRTLLVTVGERRAGMRVAVLLKAFAAAEPSAAERRALVRAACRHHRAPLAIHVGHNDMVSFRGPALPDALRASPLNLIARRLDESLPSRQLERFELLDFDAY
jgi:hypothetical protein